MKLHYLAIAFFIMGVLLVLPSMMWRGLFLIACSAVTMGMVVFRSDIKKPANDDELDSARY